MGFNRTKVELKCYNHAGSINAGGCFNRTKVELK